MRVAAHLAERVPVARLASRGSDFASGYGVVVVAAVAAAAAAAGLQSRPRRILGRPEPLVDRTMSVVDQTGRTCLV